LEQVRNLQFSDRRHAHKTLWFRGQSHERWELEPGVGRIDLSGLKEENTEDVLNIERHLSQEFKILGRPLLTENISDVQVYFLQQHYGMPTRLLDWSTNLLVGLWFAVTGNPNVNGEVFIMDAYQLKGKHTPNNFGIATEQNPTFKDALRPIFEWTDTDLFPKFIIPLRPVHLDRRITSQSSCFTFHPPNPETGKGCLALEKNIFGNDGRKDLTSFIIPKDKKQVIKEELALLAFSDFSVKGDLENLAKTLKSNYKIKFKDISQTDLQVENVLNQLNTFGVNLISISNLRDCLNEDCLSVRFKKVMICMQSITDEMVANGDDIKLPNVMTQFGELVKVLGG
jgi:hypothetical protein